MNIDYIITFCTVVEEGSFSKAAKRLNLSQPSVSLQVKALEEHFHARLLHRTAQPIALTPEGEQVYPDLREALEAFRRARRSVEETKDQGQTMRLAVGYSVGEYLLPEFTFRFREQYPEHAIAFSVFHHEGVIQRVLNGDVEAGIIGLVGRDTQYERLSSIPLFEETFHLCVSPLHPLAKRKSIPLEELQQYELIMRNAASPTRQLIDVRLAEAGVRPRMVMEMGSNEAMRASIRVGLGMGFLSSFGLESEVQAGNLVPVQINGFRPARLLRLIHLKVRPLGRTLRLFLAFLRNKETEMTKTF